MDVFRLSPGRDGTLHAYLHDLTSPEDDFALALTEADTGTAVATASSSSGYATLVASVDSGTTYCLELTGSEGDYQLSTSAQADVPVVTDVLDSAGMSVTSASRGDSLTILGRNFIPNAERMEIIFGGIRGTVDSATVDTLEVTVPANAIDGDLVVMAAGRFSAGTTFSVGETATESTLGHTEPDVAMLSTAPGNRLYLDRTLVSFAADVDRDAVEDALDDVLADLAAWSAWEIVGAEPTINLFQVEWTYADSSGTPDLDDHTEVRDALTLHDDVTGVQAETPIRPLGLTLPSDYDHLYDNDNDTGAMAQISLEEARRLLRYSGLAGLPATPSLAIFDSGLYFGMTPGGGGLTEFPQDRFGLWELHGDEWHASATPGHAGGGSVVNHGNSTAGLVGAAGQSDPDWLDGAARDHENMSGIWGSLDLFGVDDDADGETDEAGEAIDYEVGVVNDYTEAGAGPTTPASSMLFLSGLAYFGYQRGFAGLPFVFPQGVEVPARYDRAPVDDPATPEVDESKLNADLRRFVGDICGRHVLVFSAGNGGEALDSDPDLPVVIEAAMLECPATTMLVGGTAAGDYGSTADEPGYQDVGHQTAVGDLIDIVAPFDAWRLASVAGTSTPVYETGYAASGTSYSGPAVAAAVGLRQALHFDAADGDHVARIRLVADDISSITTSFGAETGRINLFEVAYDALAVVGSLPAHRSAVRVYTVDSFDDLLVSQEVDPETGVFTDDTQQDHDTSDDGCLAPADVAVHPLGDVVYVLCEDSSQVAAYTADDLAFIGAITLDGAVNDTTELTILPSGVLYVATHTGGSVVGLEAFDTWTGTREAPTLELFDSFTTTSPRGVGAAVHPDGTSTTVAASDRSLTSDDYDIIVDVQPDHDASDKAAAAVSIDSIGIDDTYRLRDLAWRWDGSAAVGVFYLDAGGGYAQLVETDFAGGTTTATVDDYCEYITAIAVDPTGNTDYGFLTCTNPGGSSHRKTAVIDLGSSPSAEYTPVTAIWSNPYGSSTDYWRTIDVEVAQNGLFLAYLQEPISSSWGFTRSMSMDEVDSAVASGGYLDTSDGDSMSFAFDTPEGLAITPTVSVANPRPGTIVRGARRLHVVVREPTATSLEVAVDGVSTCTDTELGDGVSNACMLDASGWSSGPHQVTLTLTLASGVSYDVSVPYEAP